MIVILKLVEVIPTVLLVMLQTNSLIGVTPKEMH